MTRSKSKVRERILAIERILTDKAKNAKEIMDELQKKYDISCDRKSIYQDIAILTLYLPIEQSRKGYFISNDKFWRTEE